MSDAADPVLTADHIRSAVLGLLRTPRGGYGRPVRFVHPADRAHLVQHGGGLPCCRRCLVIWETASHG